MVMAAVVGSLAIGHLHLLWSMLTCPKEHTQIFPFQPLEVSPLIKTCVVALQVRLYTKFKEEKLKSIFMEVQGLKNQAFRSASLHDLVEPLVPAEHYQA